jgi:hypothetical protein
MYMYTCVYRVALKRKKIRIQPDHCEKLILLPWILIIFAMLSLQRYMIGITCICVGVALMMRTIAIVCVFLLHPYVYLCCNVIIAISCVFVLVLHQYCQICVCVCVEVVPCFEQG